jgi:hypothetical protein
MVGDAMCERQQILAANDVVTKIPDVLLLDTEEVAAVMTVLRLLSRLLDKEHPIN